MGTLVLFFSCPAGGLRAVPRDQKTRGRAAAGRAGGQGERGQQRERADEQGLQHLVPRQQRAAAQRAHDHQFQPAAASSYSGHEQQGNVRHGC